MVPLRGRKEGEVSGSRERDGSPTGKEEHPRGGQIKGRAPIQNRP